MIRRAKEYDDGKILGELEPYIRRWFESNYDSFTPPQRFAIPQIMRRRNILVSAPTGSGKTFACFLGILNHLCRMGVKGSLEDRIYCLYISPLRALGNDIHRNLGVPLQQIKGFAAEMGVEIPTIKIATRSGDTPQSERQKMLRNPPHILITTPETAAIILNAPKFSQHLNGLEYVVVDEIHELADSKRGAHLSITLERLQHRVGDFTRVGMSATISPVKEVAEFLVGLDDGKTRNCLVADASYAKKLDIHVISPVDDLLFAEGAEATGAMYHQIKELVDAHTSTLVFTNTRSGAERVSYYLSELYVEEPDGGEYADGAECTTHDGNSGRIGAHHGSLSRETRLEVEESLKSGDMRAVACSSSLELGIDIGALDLSILVGSPKSITRLIQRVGRSGHRLDETAKGRLIVLDRDDLVESAVLARCALDGKLDNIQIVGEALDVLSQQVVGMSLTQRWNAEEAYELVRHAYPYRELSCRSFQSVLEYLSGSELEERNVYPKIWYDAEESVFGRRGRTVRGIYMTHVGTIPSESSLNVYQGKNWIGKIDEPFLEHLHKRDVFVLGGKTYLFKGARGNRVQVDDAMGANPTIPSWIGEMLPLAFDSAVEIGRFRGKMHRMLIKSKGDMSTCVNWLMEEYHLDDNAAIQVYNYFWEHFSYTGHIPTDGHILIEEFTDEEQRQNIVFHTLYGRRTLDALSRAYAYQVGKKYKTNVGVTINDNGFILRIPRGKKADIEQIPEMLGSDELEPVLRKTVRRTELFKRRFRHCATRGLMVLQQYKGYKIRLGRQQRSSEFILVGASKIRGFPIVEETFREVLDEVMDLEHAWEILRGIEEGKITFSFLHSVFPSPFAHNLVALQAADVVMMESRRELLLEFHRRVMEYIEQGVGSVS